jgi:hypothetical protein
MKILKKRSLGAVLLSLVLAGLWSALTFRPIRERP